MTPLRFRVFQGPYGVARLSRTKEIPPWAALPSASEPSASGDFYSLTVTDEEVSVVTAEHRIPEEAKAERSWSLLKVEGPLDFSLTGILAEIATILSTASIPIFAISTYDTDCILVKQDKVQEATAALKGAGHTVI